MAGFAPRPGNPSGPLQSVPNSAPPIDMNMIQQLIESFLGGPNSPIGQVLNPGANPGFGIVGPGGRGLPPPNPAGAISGGGPPGSPPAPGQERTNPIEAILNSMHGSGLGSDAMAGVGNQEGGGPPAPAYPNNGPAVRASNLDPSKSYRNAMGLNGLPATGASGQMIADAIRAMTAAGESGEGEPAPDGVPVTPGLVDPRAARSKVPLPNKGYRGQKVRGGQTLSGIAGGDINRQRMIQAANPGISDPNKIRAGDTINVPVTNVTRAKQAKPSSNKKSKKAIGSKADIQNRAMAHAKVQKKSYGQPARAGNMYGGRH